MKEQEELQVEHVLAMTLKVLQEVVEKLPEVPLAMKPARVLRLLDIKSINTAKKYRVLENLPEPVCIGQDESGKGLYRIRLKDLVDYLNKLGNETVAEREYRRAMELLNNQ